MAIELINCIKFRGKFDQVKYMTDMGCDVNYYDDSRKTALHWCVAYNETRFEDRCGTIVRFLLSRGADINTKDNRGRTPLMSFIIDNCSNALLMLLLNCGAAVTCTDIYFQTALHMYSKYKSKNIEVCRILISRMGDINIRDSNGFTSLMHFLMQGTEEDYIDMLLFYGSDVTNRSNHGNTVLHCYANWRYEAAFRTTNLKILIRLYGGGSLLNVKNSYGRTALMTFVLYKLPIKEVLYILDKGANVNESDRRGDTVLHLFFENLAVINPYTEVLQMLLEYGANPNYINTYGNTPLSVALRYGTVDHINLLYNYGLNRVHGRDFIGAYIKRMYPHSKLYKVVFKYMLLESESALDAYITPENSHYTKIRSYIDGLIEELQRMKTCIMAQNFTLFQFAAETDRKKYSWYLRNCSVNLKILEIEFPEYASIVQSKIKISNLYI